MMSVLFGLTVFLWACKLVLGTDLKLFYDRDSLILISVAPIAVAFMSHSFVDFFASVRTVFSMAFLNTTKEMNSISNNLTQLSGAVRTEGMGVIAQFKAKVSNALFRDGLTLILSGFTPDEIKHNLIAKINTRQSQFAQAVSLFETDRKSVV